MVRICFLALAAIMAVSPALGATHKSRRLADAPAGDVVSADDQKTLSDGFAPFDQAAAEGWEPAGEPVFLSTPQDMPAGAPLTLQPGAYRVVVLCDCDMMEVTLLKPDNQTIAAERSDNRRAMYSLDAPAAGAYLVGIDMDDCPKTACAIGVKVYRKSGG